MIIEPRRQDTDEWQHQNNSDNKSCRMLQDHILKIIQALIALVLLILTIVFWKGNHIGANIINFEAVILWIIGLQHVVIPFRWLSGKQTLEYEISLLLFSVYIAGKLFQLYNPSHTLIEFNIYCKYNILVPLIINLAFILLMMLVLLLYAIRHIYRLMTQTLLSTNTNLAPQEMNRIMALKRPYGQIMERADGVSQTCSICLLDFEEDSSAIFLPGCGHCFHDECIENWLQNKATCPYCRNNIRLSLL